MKNGKSSLVLNKTDIYIILPAYNESGNIRQLLGEILKTGFSFIIVDDGSIDDTSKIAIKFTPHTLTHKINLGKGAALRTGCEYAFDHLNAKAVIFMDSDNQHRVEELDSFYNALLDGHEMILGIRSFDSAMPLIRIIGNRLSSFLVLLFFGRYVPDIPSGYKALTKKMYNKLELTSSGYNIELEIAVKLAKFRLPFHSISITTIYNDLQRGFQPLDTISLLFDLLKWRIKL